VEIAIPTGLLNCAFVPKPFVEPEVPEPVRVVTAVEEIII
jgi:hypothetical protein